MVYTHWTTIHRTYVTTEYRSYIQFKYGHGYVVLIHTAYYSTAMPCLSMLFRAAGWAGWAGGM